jgi:hypothetical protein
MSDSDEIPTSSTILGPFWSPNAPFRDLGGSIIQDPTPNGQVTLMHGRVTDLGTKKGIANAVVDIWQASANGRYDFQDPENQTDNNLRGKFRTDENGYYHYYCLKPTAYSLPTDGPAGTLLKLLDRHPMRPAHIHLMVSIHDLRATDRADPERRSRIQTSALSRPRSSLATTPTSRPTPSLPSRTTWLSSSSRSTATTRPPWTWSTTSNCRRKKPAKRSLWHGCKMKGKKRARGGANQERSMVTCVQQRDSGAAVIAEIRQKHCEMGTRHDTTRSRNGGIWYWTFLDRMHV